MAGAETGQNREGVLLGCGASTCTLGRRVELSLLSTLPVEHAAPDGENWAQYCLYTQAVHLFRAGCCHDTLAYSIMSVLEVTAHP